TRARSLWYAGCRTVPGLAHACPVAQGGSMSRCPCPPRRSQSRRSSWSVRRSSSLGPGRQLDRLRGCRDRLWRWPGGLRLLFIVVRPGAQARILRVEEGRRGDARGDGPPVQEDDQVVARPGVRDLDVGHGQRRTDRVSPGATRDVPDLVLAGQQGIPVLPRFAATEPLLPERRHVADAVDL